MKQVETTPLAEDPALLLAAKDPAQLFTAVAAQDEVAVQQLLAHKADPHVVNAQSRTPLMEAALTGKE
jgi:ankyrin repeat protein